MVLLYPDGLGLASGQRTLAAASRLLPAAVTAARSVDTALAAAVALDWLPRLLIVLPSLFSALRSAVICDDHSVPAVSCSAVRLSLTLPRSVLSLVSAFELKLR